MESKKKKKLQSFITDFELVEHEILETLCYCWSRLSAFRRWLLPAIVPPTDENQGLQQSSSTEGTWPSTDGTIWYCNIPEQWEIKYFILGYHVQCRSINWKESSFKMLTVVKLFVRSLDSEQVAAAASSTHSSTHRTTRSCCPSPLPFHYLSAEVRRLPFTILLLCIHAAPCNHTWAAPQSNSPAAAERWAGLKSCTRSQYNRLPHCLSGTRALSNSANR